MPGEAIKLRANKKIYEIEYEFLDEQHFLVHFCSLNQAETTVVIRTSTNNIKLVIL